jgi:hypothetical protein
LDINKLRFSIREVGFCVFELRIRYHKNSYLQCMVRFTGAGGGGYIRALGTEKDIDKLRQDRADILFQRDSGKLLDVKVDPKGLEVN